MHPLDSWAFFVPVEQVVHLGTQFSTVNWYCLTDSHILGHCPFSPCEPDKRVIMNQAVFVGLFQSLPESLLISAQAPFEALSSPKIVLFKCGFSVLVRDCGHWGLVSQTGCLGNQGAAMHRSTREMACVFVSEREGNRRRTVKNGVALFFPPSAAV